MNDEDWKSITDANEWERLLWSEFGELSYSDLLAVERRMEKYGVPINRGLWNCPMCGKVSRECPHSYMAPDYANPTFDCRPWKKV